MTKEDKKGPEIFSKFLWGLRNSINFILVFSLYSIYPRAQIPEGVQFLVKKSMFTHPSTTGLEFGIKSKLTRSI